MDRMRDFRRLNAWQRAHQLVLAVYADSERFEEVRRKCVKLRQAVRAG